MREERCMEKGERLLEMGRPRDGWVSMRLGKSTISSLSYTDPWLPIDVCTWAASVAAERPRTLTADREGKAELVLDHDGSGLVSANLEDEMYVQVRVNEPGEFLRGLADSLEEELPAWKNHWFHSDDDEKEEGEPTTDDLESAIRMLRAAATASDASMGCLESPSEVLAGILREGIADVGVQDAYVLAADLARMVGEQPDDVQDGWRVRPPEIYSSSRTGAISCVRIGVDGSYFEDRQLAFLRDDGLVELAGWADRKNGRPVWITYLRWLLDLRERRELGWGLR